MRRGSRLPTNKVAEDSISKSFSIELPRAGSCDARQPARTPPLSDGPAIVIRIRVTVMSTAPRKAGWELEILPEFGAGSEAESTRNPRVLNQSTIEKHQYTAIWVSEIFCLLWALLSSVCPILEHFTICLSKEVLPTTSECLRW